MLETLVHFKDKDEDIPRTYTLLKVELGPNLAVRELEPLSRLRWVEYQAFTQQMGDAWLSSAETPLARVPSAIMPRTWNYLLNPEHSEARHARIVEVIKEQFDNGLFRFGAR
jgi:RES domain-containing protein